MDARALRRRIRRRSFNRQPRLRTRGRRSASSRSRSSARGSTCASASATTSRGTSASSSARRAPVCAPRLGGSQPAFRRVRAALHAKLASRSAVPWPRSVHDHASRARRVGTYELPAREHSGDSTESEWLAPSGGAGASHCRSSESSDFSARTSSVSGSSPSGEGVTAAPPGAPGASTASRSAVPDSVLANAPLASAAAYQSSDRQLAARGPIFDLAVGEPEHQDRRCRIQRGYR